MTSPIKNILIEEEKAVLNCGYKYWKWGKLTKYVKVSHMKLSIMFELL